MIESVPVKPSLFTIGHSDHEIPEFMSLLARHGVDAIADVRSQPYSRFHGQFNRETVAGVLRRAGIQYSYLGRELGARRNEPECYQGTQASYDLISRLPAFREGLERLRRGIGTHRIAEMSEQAAPDRELQLALP